MSRASPSTRPSGGRLVVCGVALAACSGRPGRAAAVDGAAEARGQAERRAAVARRRSSTRSPTLALGAVEPFSTQKLTVALKQEARQPNSLLAAEINRRKEPLEAYPAGQHGDGRQRHPQRPPLRAAARSTTCSTRSSRATTSARTTERSPRSPRPTWPTAKSCRTRPANGSSAPAPSSFRRRRDEQHSGESDVLAGARESSLSRCWPGRRCLPGRRTRSSRSTARSRRAPRSSASS